jgi:hypothetical protein
VIANCKYLVYTSFVLYANKPNKPAASELPTLIAKKLAKLDDFVSYSKNYEVVDVTASKEGASVVDIKI